MSLRTEDEIRSGIEDEASWDGHDHGHGQAKIRHFGRCTCISRQMWIFWTLIDQICLVFGESYMKSYLVLPEGHKCHDGQFISPWSIGLVWLLKEFVVAVRAWSYWTWLAIGLCVDKSNNFISAKNHYSNRVLIIISSCFGGSLSRAITAPQSAFRRNPSKFNWYLTDHSHHLWAGIVEITKLNACSSWTFGL